MIKEKLKSALTDAVEYYNSGLSANESIVKSAEKHDLTVDQTDRVVESFNTAKTINFFDKNASSRTESFDLANKKDVTLALFGDKKDITEKKASIEAHSFDSSFYAAEPDTSYNRSNIFVEKRASFLDTLAKEAEARWEHGYSNNTIQGAISDTMSFIKSAEEDINNAIGTIDSYLITATQKIASELTRSYQGTLDDNINLFKVACPHPKVIEEVSKICPLLKEATGGSYKRLAVIDTTPVDNLLKEADDIMAAVAQRKEYREKAAAFRKKASVLKEAALKDPGMPQQKVAASIDFLHTPNKLQKKADEITSALEDAALGVTEGPDTYKKINERIRDDARGAILADLLSSDPILQDADPRQVASVYKSFISASPRGSLNKEMVRSVLRGAVNSIALSPPDLKVLTDVDKGINIAHGGIKGVVS